MDERDFEAAERNIRLLQEHRIRQIQEEAKGRELTPTGVCYFCSDDLPPGVLFCPPDEFGSCQSSYERQQRARSYTGHG